MIREAVLGDIPALLDMGRRFFDASPYPALASFDPKAMEGVYSRMIESDDAVILITDDQAGCIGLLVSNLFFDPAKTVCNELFWWVNPERRGDGIRLVEAGEQWASERADLLALSAIIEMHGDRLAALYERRGMVRAETTYLKGLC